MNPMIRTLTFVAVAVISTAVAFTANYLAKPNRLTGPASYGEFFPDFSDPSRATAIQIVSFDETLASVKDFRVVHENGWRISSHNDYPADGQEQLGKAASSMISLKRGSLVTRRKVDHERYGVIDPVDQESQSLKGRGTRVTLLQKGDVPLADLIVGKKVEGSEEKRYVRKFGEDNVYMVQAKFDISTKFSDWAETDLLKVGETDLTRLRGSRPKLNEARELEGHEIMELTRDKSADPWKLADLDAATEELKTSELSTMTSTLDNLKLAGVRSKPRDRSGRPLLTSDLRMAVPAELRNDPEYLGELQRALMKNLGEKGFFLDKDEEGNRQLVSFEGELLAGTKDGVLYRLTFGSDFSGTDEEIEIGSKEAVAAEDGKSGDKKPAEKTESDKKAANDKDDHKDHDHAGHDHAGHAHAKKTKPGELKKSRYLIVRAEFDEKLLGERPVAPVKPEPPAGVEPLPDGKQDDDPKKSDKPADESKSEEKPKADDKPKSEDKDGKKEDEGAKGEDTVKATDDKKPAADPKAEVKKSDADTKSDKPAEPAKPKDGKADAPAGDKPDAKTEEPPKKDPKAEYLDAIKKYDSEKGRFNIDSKTFDAKIESGKEKVQELNDRFADWYYVISNDSFEKLRLSRADLVKKKDPPADEKKDAAKSGDTDTDKKGE